MARPAAASSSRDDNDPQPGQGEPKASKRRCVPSACVPCRRRKSKCDGGVPKCATCNAVYKTDCFYDAESENRRSKAAASSSKAAASSSNSTPNSSTAGTKREASFVTTSGMGNASSAEFIVNSIRSLPELEAYELIQHIRKDETLDLASLTDSWQQTVALPPSSVLTPSSLETDLSVLLGKPVLTQTGESRHFGHSSGLGLVPEDENYTQGRMRTNSVSVQRQGSTWTNVTQDIAFVERLLELYFKWSHPFYIVFSRECFYKDFRSGRDKYCSPLLVNAILAFACHFSDEPAARTDPSNFRTAGDHFFAEARRLLFADETPSLTTTQALCVMAMREPSAGRDSSGFMYIGRCMRMCVELGLHLSHNGAPPMNLTPSEIEVRKVTFWGCFTVDTVWSICMGRISQLPRGAITLDKPILEESQALTGEAYPGASLVAPGAVTTRMFLQEFTTLSELINDNNYMFFAPKERLTSTRLLDCYQKYQNWYKRLPQSLRLEDSNPPQPHIIVLHMLYHTVIVHLFRPMLKVDLIHSDIRPRDICLDSANKISDMLRLYRSLYSFRACHLALPHILLNICVVHLLYSKNDEISARNLVDGLRGLEDLSICHYFGARSFRIVHSLAKTWNLPFPEELKGSKILAKSTPTGLAGVFNPAAEPLLGQEQGISMRPRVGSSGYGNLPSSTLPERRDSLSMFSKRGNLRVATHVGHPKSNTMPPSQYIQSPNMSQSPVQGQPTASMPLHSYAHSQPTTSPTHDAPTTNTSPNDITENIFWTPVPGMGAPILPRNFQPSPMDIEHMMGSGNDWDRLGRDGFRVSNAWPGNSMNGFTATTTDDYGQNTQGGTSFEQSSNDGYGKTDGVNFRQDDHSGQNMNTQGGYDQGWWQTQGGGGAPMS